jgi:syntaxin 16
MASQNHTATFISLRENYWRRQRANRASNPAGGSKARVNPLNEGLANNQFDDEESLLGTAKYTLPPVWVDAKDSCEGIIKWLQEALDQLDEAYKERLVVRFDDSSYTTNDEEIDQVTKIMTRKFREAEDKLREIGRFDKTVPDAEVTVRKNVQRNLASKLQQLSVSFRRSQNDYMVRLQTQRQNSSGIGGGDDSQNGSANSAFLLTQEEEQESLTRKIQYRDAEIGRIAKSIQELATIFKELATLVIEQGTILDRIDYNMEQVVDRTERGVLELDKAEKYQRSNRANYCIFTLVALIVILFALIIARARS